MGVSKAMEWIAFLNTLNTAEENKLRKEELDRQWEGFNDKLDTVNHYKQVADTNAQNIKTYKDLSMVKFNESKKNIDNNLKELESWHISEADARNKVLDYMQTDGFKELAGNNKYILNEQLQFEYDLADNYLNTYSNMNNATLMNNQVNKVLDGMLRNVDNLKVIRQSIVDKTGYKDIIDTADMELFVEENPEMFHEKVRDERGNIVYEDDGTPKYALNAFGKPVHNYLANALLRPEKELSNGKVLGYTPTFSKSEIAEFRAKGLDPDFNDINIQASFELLGNSVQELKNRERDENKAYQPGDSKFLSTYELEDIASLKAGVNDYKNPKDAADLKDRLEQKIIDLMVSGTTYSWVSEVPQGVVDLKKAMNLNPGYEDFDDLGNLVMYEDKIPAVVDPATRYEAIKYLHDFFLGDDTQPIIRNGVPTGNQTTVERLKTSNGILNKAYEDSGLTFIRGKASDKFTERVFHDLLNLWKQTDVMVSGSATSIEETLSKLDRISKDKDRTVLMEPPIIQSEGPVTAIGDIGETFNFDVPQDEQEQFLQDFNSWDIDRQRRWINSRKKNR
tara:strand:- start:1331 stop:3022 length:1692 start_codon:yes stop_codon:yes gene_type:complete